MSVLYLHLTYEDFKDLEKQMKSFEETTHRSEGGFYHKSIRLKIDSSLIMEFHGPLVGGYGHHPEERHPNDPGEMKAILDDVLKPMNEELQRLNLDPLGWFAEDKDNS